MAKIINNQGKVVGEVFIGYFTIANTVLPIEGLMSIYDCGYSLKLD